VRSVPASRARLALLILIFAVGVTAWETPFAFRDVSRAISDWVGKNPQQRELAPAHAVAIDDRILLGARRLIPPHAIYHVAPGPVIPNSPWEAYRPLSFYWLFPRRYTNDIGPADWILSFNGGFRQLGLEYSRIWHIAPRVVVAKVRR
jgi:hypothetical protein